jgi:hypothetical protein
MKRWTTAIFGPPAVVRGALRATSHAAAIAALTLADCGGTVAPSQGVQSSCSSPLQTCAGACVDVRYDADNCGACGTSCGAGHVCSGGTCGSTCEPGEAFCGGRCTNVDSDPAHCGACTTSCPSGQVCSKGACAIDCSAGTTPCSGTCADTSVDRANCGSCGHACAAAETCRGGSCTLLCGGNLVNCGGRCADLTNDSTSCGKCGHDCLGGGCSSGSCQPVVVAIDFPEDLRNPSGAPNGIALDTSHVYWPWAYVGQATESARVRNPAARC